MNRGMGSYTQGSSSRSSSSRVTVNRSNTDAALRTSSGSSSSGTPSKPSTATSSSPTATPPSSKPTTAARGRGRPSLRGGLGSSRGGRTSAAKRNAAVSAAAVSGPLPVQPGLSGGGGEGSSTQGGASSLPGAAAGPDAQEAQTQPQPQRRGPGRPRGSGARARAGPGSGQGGNPIGRAPSYFDAPIPGERVIGPGNGRQVYSTPQLRSFPERTAQDDDDDVDEDERDWPGTRHEVSITMVLTRQVRMLRNTVTP
jgi:hypothetical protein